MIDPSNMRRVLLSIAFLFTLASVALAATKHDYQAGKLVNISDDERLSEGTTFRWAVFTVQVGDMVYTARGPRIRRHSGDPGQGLIVGDPVNVAVDGGELILLRPNGKELKAKITKRARVQ